MQPVEVQDLKVVLLLPQVQRFLRVMRLLKEKLNWESPPGIRGRTKKKGAKVKKGLRRKGQKGYAYS